MSTTILVPITGTEVPQTPGPTLPRSPVRAAVAKRDGLPDLGDVAVSDPRHLQIFLERVREIVMTREGRRGSELKRNVTLGELVDYGLAAKTSTGRYVGIGDDRARPDNYFSPPPSAVFAGVTPGFSTIFVEWVQPIYSEGGGHAYTEVWAAQYSGTGPLPVFSDASLVSKEVATFYAYQAGLQTQVHFWLINRSLADVAQTTPTGGLNGQYTTSSGMDIEYALELIAGANANAPMWSAAESITLQEVRRITGVNTKVLVCKQAGTTGGSAPSIAGAVGTIVTDGTVKWQIASTTVFAVLDAPTTINGVTLPAGAYIDAAYVSNATIQTAQIADLAVDNAKIADLSVAKLLAGNMQVGSYMRSTSFVSGSSGWTINADGTAEMQDVTVRGTVYASAGLIGGAAIGASYVQSEGTYGYIANTQGWKLDNALGKLFANSALLRNAAGTRILNLDATGSEKVLQVGDKLSIDADGVATFGGALSAATGTFAGSLSAATGTFAGSLSAATGSFAGSLSAATGTFAGTLTAAAINAVDTINIAGGAVSASSFTSGTTASISVDVVVPTGATYTVIAMGWQGGGKADPTVITLSVLGATVTIGKLSVTYDMGDSTGTGYVLLSGSIMAGSTLTAGTHTITLVGEASAQKALVVLTQKR